MKNICAVVAGFILMATLTATAATNQPPQTVEVPQLELAKVVVEVTGLARFLPVNPSPTDYFALLMANGIAPAGGWEANKPLTLYDIARVVVLAMKRGDKIEHPEDPQAWIDYLKGIGVPIDKLSVGSATKPLEPLSLPIGPTAYSSQVDATKRSPRLVPTGDVQFGSVMQPVRELFIVGPAPSPATATAPANGSRI